MMMIMMMTMTMMTKTRDDICEKKTAQNMINYDDDDNDNDDSDSKEEYSTEYIFDSTCT